MKRAIPLVLAALALAACEEEQETPDLQDVDMEVTETPETAAAPVVVQMEPTAGSDVRGTVTLTPTGGGVRVQADLTGLSEGLHGFHVHENPDCSAPDGSSAGGHFAPEGSRHGGPDEQPPEAHVGDFGNLSADASGRATYDRVFEDVALEGEHGVLGRAIIVHENDDDLVSQPSGEAGARQACGVVARGMDAPAPDADA